MVWFDLLAVQWTLKSLLQHHNPKAFILWLSAFFMVQLPHQYMTTGTMSGGLVAKSCPTLATPGTGNLPGFSVHGILQAKLLEWVAISFSR